MGTRNAGLHSGAEQRALLARIFLAAVIAVYWFVKTILALWNELRAVQAWDSSACAIGRETRLRNTCSFLPLCFLSALSFRAHGEGVLWSETVMGTSFGAVACPVTPEQKFLLPHQPALNCSDITRWQILREASKWKLPFHVVIYWWTKCFSGMETKAALPWRIRGIF